MPAAEIFLSAAGKLFLGVSEICSNHFFRFVLQNQTTNPGSA